MTFRRLLMADTTVSVFLHGLKVAVALFVNWMVLTMFEVDDFVTWSVTSSVLVIATASDLGIGQYTVTRMINNDQSAWSKEVGEALGAMLPLAVGGAAFIVAAIEGPSLVYKLTMAAILAGRILTIPFAAALNAANRFKVRKAIELGAYLVAAVGIGSVALAEADIHWALLCLNLTFLIGAVMTVIAASRHVSIRQSLALPSPKSAAGVFRAAVPFTANNLTGLLTYGGFVWLASLALAREDVAKLAVLHGFVLVNVYQLYDVFLKARQGDLVDPGWIRRMRILNWLAMAAIPPAFILVGRQALALIGNPIPISLTEAALFGVFMSLEMGNLFAQSIIQVNAALADRLKTYSLLRLFLLVAFGVAGWMPTWQEPLSVLLALLSVVSFATFLFLMRGLSTSPTPVTAASPRDNDKL